MVHSDGMVHFLKIENFFFLRIYQNYRVALIVLFFFFVLDKKYSTTEIF